jgi:hypothetical protein
MQSFAYKPFFSAFKVFCSASRAQSFASPEVSGSVRFFVFRPEPSGFDGGLGKTI